MKKLTLILLLVPMIVSAQDDVYGSKNVDAKETKAVDSIQHVIDKYVVENQAVTYVSIFEVPGKSQDDIKNLAIKAFSSNPKLLVNQSTISNDQISGSISNLVIDYRKYGYKWGNIAVWILHPAFANFTVQFKDGKYRVILKAIKTVATPNLTFDFNLHFATKDNTLGGINNKTAQRAYYAFGKNIDELFNINQRTNSEW